MVVGGEDGGGGGGGGGWVCVEVTELELGRWV